MQPNAERFVVCNELTNEGAVGWSKTAVGRSGRFANQTVIFDRREMRAGGGAAPDIATC
jgi:hypothetical protein